MLTHLGKSFSSLISSRTWRSQLLFSEALDIVNVNLFHTPATYTKRVNLIWPIFNIGLCHIVSKLSLDLIICRRWLFALSLRFVIVSKSVYWSERFTSTRLWGFMEQVFFYFVAAFIIIRSWTVLYTEPLILGKGKVCLTGRSIQSECGSRWWCHCYC